MIIAARFLCLLTLHSWTPRLTKRGGHYDCCARCGAERIGGLIARAWRR